MARRLLTFYRTFSSTRALQASLAEPLKEEAIQHAHDSVNLWKKLFYYVCCPALALIGISVYLEDEPERPKFVKYSHLRIRRGKFPWRDGVKSLFHNPHLNALPDGYEDEIL